MRHATWRYIFLLLTFLGGFATMAIAGMLFWMTHRLDTLEHDRASDLLSLTLKENQAQLTHAVEDYSYWTHAYDIVMAGDEASIQYDLGTGATEAPLFDQIFILNSAGDVLYAFEEDTEVDAIALYDKAAFAQTLGHLLSTSPESYMSTNGVVESRDGYAMVSAAWITPDSIEDLGSVNLPIFVGVRKLDEGWIASFERIAGIEGTSLQPAEAGNMGDTPVLRGPMGQPVATFNWSKSYSGTMLFHEIAPGILLMCLGILGICGSAARYFHKQHHALERARRVASTDQLTGLLNRAGLEDVLRRKDIAQALEDGHLATIYLDLNKFKALNDTHGHKAGDIALKVTAERLAAAIRKGDFAARLGGDEFVCLIQDDTPEEAAVSVANRIIEMAKSPIAFWGHQEVITSSVGVSVGRPGIQWETLLTQSDAAMYWSKKKNARTPIVFCKSMHDPVAVA